jgi:NADH:ubiquinone oxidoreductase subunit 6 (subunit J)
MNAAEILFLLFAIAACGGALAVVFSQNVARMAFWLIVSLGSTSGLFFLLRADFVGATQLLVYVGGTVVLLIFGVMLTASGPFVRIKTSPGELVLAGGVGILLLSMIYSTVYLADWSRLMQTSSAAMVKTGRGYNPADEGNTARPIGMKLIGASVEDLGAQKAALSAAYLLPFEIVSIHLLVVLIGAAYLARAKRRVVPPSRRGVAVVPSEGGKGTLPGTIHEPTRSGLGGHAATHEVATHG